ncbi:MAG TPA: hypothetical protein VMH26_12290 [Burkholderiales bacterium]|nr:hypothetical protein [Burkholderiales bacterium]
MSRIGLSALLGAFVAANLLCATPEAAAQQKYTISQAPNTNSQYLQEHTVEVDDVPGHRLRVYEIRQEYPQKDLAFAGVVVTEGLSRNMSDAINGNGSFTYYMVYSLEDGNKVFCRGTGTTQADSTVGYRFVIVENFVGGTGKFKGMRGQVRGSGVRAPGATSLKVEWKGEYWIED